VSNSPSQQIAFLRELLKKGFYQENLEHLAACCSGLAQDTSYALPFFVLKAVFREMAFHLDDGPTPVSSHGDLVSDLASPINRLLDRIANNEEIAFAELDAIVRTHLRNAGLFDAGPN
jgi:hypothetical protein